MVNSPITMAKVRKAPLSTAVRTLGRMTLKRIRGQPAPRVSAASVSVRTSMARKPGIDRPIHVGQCQGHIAEGQQQIGAALIGRERDPGGTVVDPDIAEDEHDGRDHQRQQGDELDHGAQARQPQLHPIGRRHHQQHADDDGRDRQHRRVAEGGLEPGIGTAPPDRHRSYSRRGACAARTRKSRSAARRNRACR